MSKEEHRNKVLAGKESVCQLLSDVLLKSCLEQQVEMTDIPLPRCVCVFPLILQPINNISDLQRVYPAAVDALIGPSLSCRSGHRNNASSGCRVSYRGSGCRRTAIRCLEVMSASGLVSGR